MEKPRTWRGWIGLIRVVRSGEHERQSGILQQGYERTVIETTQAGQHRHPQTIV